MEVIIRKKAGEFNRFLKKINYLCHLWHIGKPSKSLRTEERGGERRGAGLTQMAGQVADPLQGGNMDPQRQQAQKSD